MYLEKGDQVVKLCHLTLNVSRLVLEHRKIKGGFYPKHFPEGFCLFFFALILSGVQS